MNYVDVIDEFSPNVGGNLQNGVQFLLALSHEVVLEKRVVGDILTILADIGGLYDFYALILFAISSLWSNEFMLASLV